MITWQNDPLLLDQKPVGPNNWITANVLLEKNASNVLYLTSNTFNLYGALVRKIDFIRTSKRDRIFARMPYIHLTKPLKDLIKEKFEYWF